MTRDEVRHMIHKIRSKQASKALAVKAKQEANFALPALVKPQVLSVAIVRLCVPT